MLRSARIRLIQFEYGYTNGDAHCLMRDFFNCFGAFDYEVGVLKLSGIIFTKFNYRLNDFTFGLSSIEESSTVVVVARDNV